MTICPERSGAAALRHGGENCESKDDDAETTFVRFNLLESVYYQARGGRRHLPERSGAAALRHGGENCENKDDDEGDDTCLERSGAAALRHGGENCENEDDDEGDDTCLERSGAAALRHGSENCENKDGDEGDDALPSSPLGTVNFSEHQLAEPDLCKHFSSRGY